MAREGNNPKRRLDAVDTFTDGERRSMAGEVVYVGSGHHKRFPGDYGLSPPTSPRPSKSLCDGKRPILKTEAQGLLASGIQKGTVSRHKFGIFPKFVWSVDAEGEVYEAKTDQNAPGQYHGYRLEEEDEMRNLVLKSWNR